MAACTGFHYGNMYQDQPLSPLASKASMTGENVAPPVDTLPALQDHEHHPDQSSSTGRPIFFSSGQFTGFTIRMELDEVQKADLGRKYARVDRRPLDPPPVVHLKVFEIQNAGTDMEIETEMDYDDVQVLGLICTVDLFSVPDSFAPNMANINPGPTGTGSASSHPFTSPSSTRSDDNNTFEYSRPNPSGSVEWQNHPPQFTAGIFPSLHHCENSKHTQALAGATFVQAVKVEYQGKKAILFAFSDLAVKTEGAFILRYKVFDLFSSSFAQNNDSIVTAETYGGSFRVYSTKDFPGLNASTDLTKNLARWGVRLNLRETERRGKKSDNCDLHTCSALRT